MITKRKLAGATVVMVFICVNLHAEEEHPTRNATVSWSGSDSHFSKKRTQRILNRDEWIAVWLEHQGIESDDAEYDDWHNFAKVPEVDFASQMVIAIFEGQTVNCAGLTEAHLHETENAIVFRFQFKGYSTDDGFDKVKPFGLFVVPKSDKSITIQIPKPGPKDRPNNKEWESYARIVGVTNMDK